MNIISNCCLGAHIYELNGMQYSNPFIWSSIYSEHLLKLMEQYDTIDFENISLEKSAFYPDLKKNGLDAFYIIIDNLVNVHYVHYRFDANFAKPGKNKTSDHSEDIFYCRNWEYVVEKYRTRLARMKKLAEEPIFVILCDTEFHDENYDMQLRLLETAKKFNRNLILISKYEEFTAYNSDKIHVICDTNRRSVPGCYPIAYAKRHINEINDFINAVTSNTDS